jgi:transglutaminase-like putative cysteine protease
MIRYRVVHTSQYKYSLPVSLGYNEAYLLPRSSSRQHCHNSQVLIQPPPAVCAEREDFFGNRVTHFVIQEPFTTLAVTARSEVQVVPADIPDLRAGPSWEEARQRLYRDLSPEGLEARQSALDSPLVHTTPELAAYAAPSFNNGRPLLEAVEDLMRRIHQEFTYDLHFTTVATPLGEVLRHHRGVCQDFAHLAVGCLRSLGLAARYVSGYLGTDLSSSGEASASHAWFAVYSPQHGWIDFDPTNNHLPTDRHITLAWGRDYSDVTPLKGILFGDGDHTLRVAVEVTRL